MIPKLLWTKIVFHELSESFLIIDLAFLEAEICRFLLLQLAWYTLYLENQQFSVKTCYGRVVENEKMNNFPIALL